MTLVTGWIPLDEAPESAKDGSYQWIGRDGISPFADFMRWTGARWEFCDGSYIEAEPSHGNMLFHPLPPAPEVSHVG